MALPSFANLSKKQKILGLSILTITGLVIVGGGRTNLQKKKLPTGGVADYLKSLGGGGGGGGGGKSSSSSPPPTTPTTDGGEEEESEEVPLDPGLAQALTNEESELYLPFEDKPSLSALGDRGDKILDTLQLIREGNFSWTTYPTVNTDYGQGFYDDAILREYGEYVGERAQVSAGNIGDATDGWLQQYINEEEIELEETDTVPLDPWITTALMEQDEEESSDDEVPLDPWILTEARTNPGVKVVASTGAGFGYGEPYSYTQPITLSPSSSGFGYSL